MNMKKEVVLNIHFIRNKIVDLSLKQWWIAEQVGVNPKTIRRWLQGKIKSVKVENAQELAKILESDLDSIILDNEKELLATPEDQKLAAELISSSSLIEKLGPIHEWNVVEALLKATMIPSLPAFVLGELYNKLSVASWRQSKIDQAFLYAEKAYDLALRLNNNSIRANSLLNLANIYSWKGETLKSIEKYNECLKLHKFLEKKTVGTVTSNLGAVLWEIGDLEKAHEIQLKALTIFKEEVESDINLSICYCQLSFISLEKKLLKDAETFAYNSIQFAKIANYKRGEQMGKLVLSEIMARQGNKVKAMEYVEDALTEFSKLGIEEGFNYEYAGRTFRILEEYTQAMEYLNRGIQLAESFPIYLAALYKEIGVLSKHILIEIDKSNEYFNKSIHLYKECEAPLRVKEVKSLMNSIK